MYLRRRGRGGGDTPKKESIVVAPKEEKKTFGVKLQEGVGKVAHGLGTVIQGAIIATDRTLESSASASPKKNKKVSRRSEKREKRKRDLEKQINGSNHFSEEQKKELSSLFKDFPEEEEFEDLTEEQGDDDEYYGVTDPGLTAPKITMGLRNSFGDFFGNTADAIESRSVVDRSERKTSIYI